MPTFTQVLGTSDLENSQDGTTIHTRSTTPNTLAASSVSEVAPLLPKSHGDSRPKHTISAIKAEAWILLCYAIPIFGTQILEYSLMVASRPASERWPLDPANDRINGINNDSYSWNLVKRRAILLKLRQEPAISRLAGEYLRWFSLSLPGQAISIIMRRFYQAQGLAHIPTAIMVVIAPINALLCWLLVWGPRPLNAGFIGAPVASAISFNLMAVISLVYARWFIPNTALHPINRQCFCEIGKLFRLGLSGVGQIASEWWSWEFVALAASQLGPTPLAAQSVMLVSSSIAFQTPYSLGMATTVRVGNLLGSGHAQMARLAAETAIGMSLVVAMILSTIFMTFRSNWGYLFSDEEKVVSLVASVLPVVALFQIVDGATAVTDGVLRARGMLGLGAIINICSYYVIGLPIGIALAFWAHLGLKGLWTGLSIALFCAAVISMFVVYKTNWDLEVSRACERLAEEREGGVLV